jgi:hypothetical protein
MIRGLIQDVLSGKEPNLLEQAKNWAKDCEWGETESDPSNSFIDLIPDEKLLYLVNQHYDGGLKGFIMDNRNTKMSKRLSIFKIANTDKLATANQEASEFYAKLQKALRQEVKGSEKYFALKAILDYFEKFGDPINYDSKTFDIVAENLEELHQMYSRNIDEEDVEKYVAMKTVESARNFFHKLSLLAKDLDGS